MITIKEIIEDIRDFLVEPVMIPIWIYALIILFFCTMWWYIGYIDGQTVALEYCLELLNRIEEAM